MINLAPWYYRNLLIKNDIILIPEFYEVILLDGRKQFESTVFLNSTLRPKWISNSKIYKNSDGSGTSKYKNVAIYKAISEALERLAFYETGEKEEKNFCFDLNPTTTGLAAFPHFNSNQARLNAKAEAIERWAIHEFNRSRLPVNAKYTTIKKLNYYEILTPFKEIVVTLLSFHHENFYAYSFAAGINSQHSFDRALIELDRNIRVLKKSKEENRKYNDASPGVDKTILYFSTEEGYSTFQNYIERSPSRITNTFPIVICDKELKGYWTQYAKVWRYLLEDSYFNCTTDHTFFMF